MGLRSWLKKRSEDELYSESINSMDSRSHSRAYHRFFAGYTEVKKAKPGGLGYTIERVYTGTYFERSIGKKKSIALKALYLILYAVCVCLFVSAVSARVETNSLWYIAALVAVSTVSLAWCGVGMYNYAIAPMKMKRYEYNSSSRSIIHSTACSAISLGAMTLTIAVYLLVCRPEEYRTIAACAGKTTACAAVMLAVNRIEASLKYEKTASEMNGKVNGVEIQ